MEILLRFLELARPFLSISGAIAGVCLMLYLANRLLNRGETGISRHRFRNQLIMLGLSFAGLLAIIMMLPIGDTSRGQLLSLIGILLSAAIALSSTTFLGNAMAGIMLKAVRNFRTGDFIQVEGHFGRVSERGLVHTEIQTEHRELTTLSNLYLITHPVTVVRTSGTIVSAHVSLGYDVSRKKIEELLLAAAQEAELSDPFVHILELGDFSVTYRVAGLLTDIKLLLSTRSRLRGLVMDHLHRGGVEIVSPSFMNQRPLPDGKVFIPRRRAASKKPPPEETVAPEEVVFDKAEQAESVEMLREEFKKTEEEIKNLETSLKEIPEGSERTKLERQLERIQKGQESLAATISEHESNESDTGSA